MGVGAFDLGGGSPPAATAGKKLSPFMAGLGGVLYLCLRLVQAVCTVMRQCSLPADRGMTVL